MKATDNFKKTIKRYLEQRGSKDPLFARIVTKPGKNMDNCITYILNTVKKSGCSGFTDDEVYNMAIHYFDEDGIDVGGSVNCKVVVNHTVILTEEEKAAARQKAMDDLANEIKAKARKKPVKAEEKKEEKKDAPVVKMAAKEQTLF